jgi:3-mercaptopyruvate sulfurtransferase SseA
MTRDAFSVRIGAAFTLIMLAGAGLMGGCAEDITDADIKPVAVAEVRALTLRQAERPESTLIVLIDPRAGARFNAGHLPGARNLKLPQVPPKSGPDPVIAAYDHIVVYGTDPGNAAAQAMTKRLLSVGYRHVRMFAGGVREWVERGYALETSPGTAPEAGTPVVQPGP